MTENEGRDEISRALLKRAKGYVSEEIIEEYAVENKKEDLIKRKIIKKTKNKFFLKVNVTPPPPKMF